jgi:hypothetical protein
MHPLYSAAKLAIGLLAAGASGGSYLLAESIVSETTLIPLGVAVLIAFYIANWAFKWGSRLTQLENRIATLEGKRDGNGVKR